MKSNACFENFGVTSVISNLEFLFKKGKRNFEIHEIYYLKNGKNLAIRKNSRACRLYVKRHDDLIKSRENCANAFQEMFSMFDAYVIFTYRQDEEYDFSQQLRDFSKLFSLYKKKALKAFKELETFREFKFDSTLKEEIFSLEFGKIKTRDKIDELATRFYTELFDQK